jgi:hypothetical protein
MLSIAELAHHRDPEAIAEFIRRKLQHLDTELLDTKHLVVEVAIVDSSLELQIRTDSAIDKEKLLTLVRSELQNLRIESVAKFRIHCWRNDEEIHEQRLLWTEQFMLEPPKLSPRLLSNSSSLQGLELESDKTRSPEMRSPEIGSSRSSEIRSPEPQLSKQSVLQQAIAQMSSTSLKAHKHLLANDLTGSSSIDGDLTNPVIALNSVDVKKTRLAIDNNYWQLLLVGLSIVLLGLGIGAFVRAITLKNTVDKISETSSPNLVPAKSSKAKVSMKAATTQSPPASQINDSSAIATKTPSKNNPINNPPSPVIAETPISASPTVAQGGDTVITLEKFNRIQKGMTIEQVERILGSSGKVIAENNSVDSVGQVYSWKNLQGSNAIVEFKDGQVVAKAQAGL